MKLSMNLFLYKLGIIKFNFKGAWSKWLMVFKQAMEYSVLYPHFGPKKYSFNFLCYFLIFSNTLCFLLCSKRILCYYYLQFSRIWSVFCITSHLKGSLRPLHIFLHFVPIFRIKSYKRVFWSFPTKEPILVPTFVPESFQLVCMNHWSNFVQKSS